MTKRTALAILVLLCAVPGQAAELRLRESLLAEQRDRATITIQAVVDHLGRAAHGVAEDCDLHVPLRSRDIWVPLLGELKNACSMPPGVSTVHWRDALFEETHGRAVDIVGVFRIWQEHPPRSGRQMEREFVDWYGNSNPDHQVELHPILQIGDLDFRPHVRAIRLGDEEFEAKTVSRLPGLLRREIEIQRVTGGGESLIRIEGRQVGLNHWRLRGRLAADPEDLADGTRAAADILRDGQVVPGAAGIPLVSIAGTDADALLRTLRAGDAVDFLALVRLSLGTVLDQARPTARPIDLPIEFVLLDAAEAN